MSESEQEMSDDQVRAERLTEMQLHGWPQALAHACIHLGLKNGPFTVGLKSGANIGVKDVWEDSEPEYSWVFATLVSGEQVEIRASEIVWVVEGVIVT